MARAEYTQKHLRSMPYLYSPFAEIWEPSYTCLCMCISGIRIEFTIQQSGPADLHIRSTAVPARPRKSGCMPPAREPYARAIALAQPQAPVGPPPLDGAPTPAKHTNQGPLAAIALGAVIQQAPSPPRHRPGLVAGAPGLGGEGGGGAGGLRGGVRLIEGGLFVEPFDWP